MESKQLERRQELIAMNVANLRGDRSQKDVAEAMRSRGHKWSQATMWSIEQGTRPLKFSEAIDLAQVLEVELLDLLRPKIEAALVTRLKALTDDAQEMGRTLLITARAYENDTARVREAAADLLQRATDEPSIEYASMLVKPAEEGGPLFFASAVRALEHWSGQKPSDG